MTSAYYAPLVLAPMVIVAPGEYVTRCGETVTVTAASARHEHGCVGQYPNEVREAWHRSGRIFANMETQNDIVRAL